MLYIVATPIGNLQDISHRAIDILQQSDLILAEDTRRTKILLNYYKIKAKKIISLHEHNEQYITNNLINLLQKGSNIALVSDAGTPLISDPGYNLVKAAHHANIPVSPVPGPSAVIAAISASGLATDRFVFYGFLPTKTKSLQELLLKLAPDTKTMVFFESPTRILTTLKNMLQVFRPERQITFCREITKKFETIKKTNLAKLYNFIIDNKIEQTKGEIVLVVAGNTNKNASEIAHNAYKILTCLLQELPLTKAASVTANITGITKKQLYNYGLSLIDQNNHK